MVSAYLEERYRELFGSDFLRELEVVPHQAIRVNTLRTSEEELIPRLEEKGFVLEKVPFTNCGYWIKKAPFSAGATPEYLMGHYFLQDAASQYSCEALNPQKNDVVLDVAAAPGGKTTHMAQIMENTGAVVSLEVNRERMGSLRSNVTRMGVENCIGLRMDAHDVKDLGLEFDRVLLDAPCTGTGTVFKNPEAAEKTQKDVEATTVLQEGLFEASYNVLKPGGVMVYSTCSFLAEENEMMVEKALGKFSMDVMDVDFGEAALESPYGIKLSRKIKRARRFFPIQNGTQGFFIAKLRKVI